MRRHGRTDANQAAIVEKLRAQGWRVCSLAAVGAGVPDLLVGAGGCNVLLEVKTLGGSLTDDQQEWHRDWTGQAAVVYSPTHAVEAVRLLLRDRSVPCSIRSHDANDATDARGIGRAAAHR